MIQFASQSTLSYKFVYRIISEPKAFLKCHFSSTDEQNFSLKSRQNFKHLYSLVCLNITIHFIFYFLFLFLFSSFKLILAFACINLFFFQFQIASGLYFSHKTFYFFFIWLKCFSMSLTILRPFCYLYQVTSIFQGRSRQLFYLGCRISELIHLFI